MVPMLPCLVVLVPFSILTSWPSEVCLVWDCSNTADVDMTHGARLLCFGIALPRSTLCSAMVCSSLHTWNGRMILAALLELVWSHCPHH
jgi:hypothetical protein